MTDLSGTAKARAADVRNRSREFIPGRWWCWRGPGAKAKLVAVPFPINEATVLAWNESAHEPIPARDPR